MLENYIVKVFPFLAHQMGRAAVYIILSSFCFSDEMGWFGKVNGIMMLICAGLAIYIYAFTPLIPPNTNVQAYYPDES